MPNSTLRIADDFPPVQYDTWRAAVEDELKGVPFDRKLVTHTYEGIDIQPVYTLRDRLSGDDPSGFPGAAPFIRGSSPLGHVLSGVDLRQEHAHPDLEATNNAILADLQGGVTSLLLRLDRATRCGFRVDDPGADAIAGVDGMMAYDVDDFQAALQNVQLELVDIAVDAGAAFLPAAATLAALWQRRGITPDNARGAFNADPLATLAAEGQLPTSVESSLSQLAQLARWTLETYPKVIAVSVDTSPYHDSGATAAEDIAFSMATAVQYLRAMTDGGLNASEAANQILFRMSLGTHHFLAIAKLRAARQLWSRILEACSAKPAGMQIHARTSNRVMTQRDPYVNLLRNSVSVFAALLGGADCITSLPLDHAAQLPDDFSRRIARNTVLILQEESHLHRVLDPAGGSWFIESLTNDLAKNAWSIFQQIERQGGMLTALQSGWVSQQIDTAYAPRAKDIAKRKEGITGVSEFPNLNEERVQHSPPDIKTLHKAAKHRVASNNSSVPIPETITPDGYAMSTIVATAAAGATLGQLGAAIGFDPGTTKIKAIESHAFAQPFEELRDASDAWVESHGKRPQVFSANLGPVAHFTARATYAKNFFESGGFEVLTSDGFSNATAAAEAFRHSGAPIAVICSSDKLYADMAAPVASALKAAGAQTVILAGNPGENETAWTQSGIDQFIYIKCDVLGTLRDLLRQQKVLPS
jgi:methylmalonyl-CoA mutase